jgi:hypothetical protein
MIQHDTCVGDGSTDELQAHRARLQALRSPRQDRRLAPPGLDLPPGRVCLQLLRWTLCVQCTVAQRPTAPVLLCSCASGTYCCRLLHPPPNIVPTCTYKYSTPARPRPRERKCAVVCLCLRVLACGRLSLCAHGGAHRQGSWTARALRRSHLPHHLRRVSACDLRPGGSRGGQDSKAPRKLRYPACSSVLPRVSITI